MQALSEKGIRKHICEENVLSARGKLKRHTPVRGKSPAPANHPWRQYKMTVKRQGNTNKSQITHNK